MSKRLLLFPVLFLLLFSNVYSQKTSPKEKKLTVAEQSELEKAQYYYEQKNYRLAIPIFETLLQTHLNETMIKYFTALCYVSHPDKHPLMLEYFLDVYDKNKKADKIEYEIARAYFFNYKFNEATDYLEKYSSKLKNPDDNQKKEIDELSNYIKNAKALAANPLNVTITNWGRIVNTSASECSPFIDINDTFLIYTYRGELSAGGLQNAYNEADKNGIYYEDVFTSTKVNDVWTKPYPLLAVNSDNNDEALSISYDGQTLFTSRDNPEDDGDIYMSKWINNEWSPAVKLKGDINTPAWEDNCTLSPDGRTLYFSSTRPGGFGGKDIYKSNLLPDSTWGPAKNLGDKINTAEDEDDPFIHLDGKLFTFSSKGHNSMGGYDIFKTYLNPVDSTWAPVENIGYPINTPNDDIHYSISPGGDKGYYSIAKPDGFGDNDLYTVEPGITGIMPTMLVVKGTVLSDNKPVQCNIEVTSNNKIYKKITSNPATGLYFMVLPLGQDYKFTWRLKDSAIKTDNIDVASAKEYVLKIKDVYFKSKTIDTTDNGGNLIVEGLTYKIQVSAHCLNKNIKYKKVKEYGKIESNVVDNIPRFTLDKEYKTLNQINEALEKVRKIAVPDAFVIATYKGKRCYLYELWKQGIIPEQK